MMKWANTSHGGGAPSRRRGIPDIMREDIFRWKIRAPEEATSTVDNHPYLLVLLADQDLSAGRENQARALIEAAYASFDRRDWSL